MPINNLLQREMLQYFMQIKKIFLFGSDGGNNRPEYHMLFQSWRGA
jgi:hypothetical protein